MNFIADLPKSPGTYRHRWIDHAGRMKEQTLFVGYTNARAPLLQGTEPNAYMPRKLKCCQPEEYLHADRLTPEEWGGWWGVDMAFEALRITALAEGDGND